MPTSAAVHCVLVVISTVGEAMKRRPRDDFALVVNIFVGAAIVAAIFTVVLL